MSRFEKINVERLAAWGVTVTVFGVLIYLALRYLFPVLLPFLIAWGVAMAVRPLAEHLHKRIKIPVYILRLILLLILLSLLFLTIFLLASRLLLEAEALLRRLSENSEWLSGLTDRFNEFLADLRRQFPAFSNMDGGVIEESLLQFLRDGAGKLLSYLTDFIGGLLMALPNALFAVTICVIAAFYFALDLNKIHEGVRSLLPSGMRHTAHHAKEHLKRTALAYIRAYSLLALLTFSLLFFGFAVLKIKYALLLALIFTLVDVLPVLGVGTLLVPWGLFCLITGDFRLGTGLLILFAVVTVVRQLAEPKIIGTHMGIHPLVTLFSMYIGFRFFGLFGLIFGPLGAVVIKSLLSIISDGEEKASSDTKSEMSAKG